MSKADWVAKGNVFVPPHARVGIFPMFPTCLSVDLAIRAGHGDVQVLIYGVAAILWMGKYSTGKDIGLFIFGVIIHGTQTAGSVPLGLAKHSSSFELACNTTAPQTNGSPDHSTLAYL